MPIYEYRDRCTGEVVEEVYASWRDAPEVFVNPKTGCVGDRLASRLGRTEVIDESRAEARRLERQGIVPVEAGMGRDFNEARIAREKKDDAALGKVIQDTLASF